MEATKNTYDTAVNIVPENEHAESASDSFQASDSSHLTCESCGTKLDSEAAFCPACECGIDDAPDYDTPDSYLYEAFISYRHTPRDSEVAKNLQRMLEGFAIPPELRKGVSGKKRFGKLFRDEDELPASPSLSARIRDALKQSRFLIVVCSSETVNSRWVSEEVRLFASYHGRSRICIALTEGEVEDNVPEFLLTKQIIDTDGAIKTVSCDPLAADFRQNDRKQQRQEALRIAAMMLGCGYDDLKQRGKARKLRMATTGASVVAAISIAFGTFSLSQQAQIETQYRATQIKHFESLASESQELLETGERMEAIQVAMAALPEDDGSSFVPSAQFALEQALNIYPSDKEWANVFDRQINDSINWSIDKSSGRLAIWRENRWIDIVDMANGNVMWSLDTRRADFMSTGLYAYTPTKTCLMGDSLLCYDSTHSTCFSISNDKLLWANGDQGFDVVSSCNSGTQFVGASSYASNSEEHASFGLFETSTGKLSRDAMQAPFSNSSGFSKAFLCCSENGEFASLVIPPSRESNTSKAYFADFSDGNLKEIELPGTCVNCYSIGSKYYAITRNESEGNTVSMVVRAFNYDASELWTCDLECSCEYLSQNERASLTGLLAGVYDNNEADDIERLVITCGRDLFLLDERTGESFSRFSVQKPVSAAAVLKEGDKQCALTYSTDGTVMRVSLNDQGFANIADSKTEIGESSKACFVSTGEEEYLVRMNSKVLVSRYLPKRSASSASDINETLVKTQWNLIDDDNLFAYTITHEEESTPSAIAVFDSKSFELVCSVDMDKLDQLDPSLLYTPKVGFTSDPDKLFIVGKDKTAVKGFILYVVSARTGEILTTTKLPGIDGIPTVDIGTTSKNGPSPIVISSSQYLYVVDILSGDIVLNGSSYVVQSARLVNDTLVLCTSGGLFGNSIESSAREGLGFVDLLTGKVIHSNLEEYLPADEHNNSCYISNSKGSCLAVSCSDGSLRLFSIPQGDLIWEAKDLSSDVRFMTFCNDDSSILAQDRSGRCALIDATSGDVLATSAITCPPISSVIRTEENKLLLRGIASTSDATWIAVFSTEENAFGIQSLYHGAQSLSANQILFYDKRSDAFDVMPRYSLDELLAMSREATEGFELTGAQRLQYRID